MAREMEESSLHSLLEADEQASLIDLARDSLAAAERLKECDNGISFSTIGEEGAPERKALRDTLPLPIELKNLIYELLLESRPSPCSHDPDPPIAVTRRTEARSVMFSVSKRTRAESLIAYYTYRPQSFQTTNALYSHLRPLSHSRLECIQHVSLICRGTCAKEAFQILERCTGLKTCKLYFAYGIIPAIETLYRIRGVGEAKTYIVPLGERAEVELGGYSQRFIEEIEDVGDAMMRARN